MFKLNIVSAAALIATASSALAQQTLEWVEITGSAIRRSISDEGALPITVVKVDDLCQQGVTSVEGIMELISASQSSSPGTNSIGCSTGGAARPTTATSTRTRWSTGPERTSSPR